MVNQRIVNKLYQYINEIENKNIKNFCLENFDEYKKGCPKHSSHPNEQKLEGGLGLHTIQVIEKALELNQHFDRKEIIECCLVHDIKSCEKLQLSEKQKNAIATTKGMPYSIWRRTKDYRFVVLILIADMWSAFINEKNE